MRTRLAKLLVVATVVATTACASAGAVKSSGSSDRLTRADIEATNVTSVYDVISRLRPTWLRPPGMTMSGIQNSGPQQVLVYMDDHKLGPIEVMRSVTTATVTSIEYLNATKAAVVVNDMNTGNVAAVIMIRTK